MDSVRSFEFTQDKSRLARAFAKFLHVHSGSGTGSGDAKKKMKKDQSKSFSSSLYGDENEEEQKGKLVKEAFFAGIFCSLSTIKAAYAQMQMAECPYDPEQIHSADDIIVSQLKNLSELKHSFLKQQLQEISLETTIESYEIQELKSVVLTYEVTAKKLDSQLKIKDSELAFLREKLAEVLKENRVLEKRMNNYSTGRSGVQGSVSLSSLTPSDFTTYYHQAVKSIQGFVRMLIRGMESVNWDVAAGADAIEPGVTFLNQAHLRHAFESHVCREMFDGFNYPDFFSKDKLFPDQENRRSLSFGSFLELKSMKPLDYLARKPKSRFATYCQKKYLRLVHPKMESSLFGNLEQWHLVNSGNFPETQFFSEFGEMAKHIWLLHCLAFSFDPEVTIFQLSKGSCFSEVWMESLNDGEALFLHDPQVAFTVIPGFKVCGTVVQCQVYLN